MTTPLPPLTNRIAFYESNIAMNIRLGSKAECCLWKNRPKTTPQAHVNAFQDAMIFPVGMSSNSSNSKHCSTKTMTTATATSLLVESAHKACSLTLASSPNLNNRHRGQASLASSCTNGEDDWSPSTTHVDAMDDNVCRKRSQETNIPSVIFIVSRRQQHHQQQQKNAMQNHQNELFGSRARPNNDGRVATSEQSRREDSLKMNHNGDDDDDANHGTAGSRSSNNVPTLHAYFHGKVMQQKRNAFSQQDSSSTLATSSVGSFY